MSARESLRAKLVTLLEEEMGESFPLPQDDQDLRESLGLDSVDLVGLVMRIEREFRVRLAPEELATGQARRRSARPDGSEAGGSARSRLERPGAAPATAPAEPVAARSMVRRGVTERDDRHARP